MRLALPDPSAVGSGDYSSLAAITAAELLGAFPQEL